ncbi:MAG: type II secretory pathway, component PulD [Opitutaceae bacterium]|nr:type II secretory pathway, component PulD [Opitutaceae bacterium]
MPSTEGKDMNPMSPGVRRCPVTLKAGRLLVLAFCLAVASHAVEAPPATTSDETVGPVQLREVSLDQVLEMFERWSGRTMLRPQALPSVVVNLNLDKPVSKAEAMRAIETVLQLNGIGLSPLGETFIKATPLGAVKSEAPELIEGSTLGLPPSGRTASKVFRLNFLQVGELMPQLATLLNSASAGAPVIFEKANAALITDSVSNLQRVETLVAQLDQPSLTGLEPRFYSLHYAKASDVVNKIRATFSGVLQNRLGTATVLNADDRTNQVLVVTDPRQYAFFDSLIAKLDLKSEPNTRNEVIHLKSAAAKDVATTLSQMVSGQNAAGRNSGDVVRPGVPASTAPPTDRPTIPSAPNPVAAAIPALLAESTAQFSPFLTILPDERSNSLIVSGTVDDIRLIRDFVEKIDVLLAQVRIEVVIAEVTLSNASSTGISELGLKVEGDKLIGVTASLPGLAVGDGTITRPDGTNVVTGPWDLAGAITLASTPRKTNANILSVPTIITTHNREGKIFVGESRPVISSYLNDAGSTGGSTAGYRSTVSSKDIGIQLSVKPLIGSDGSVQLEIKQEVNDILGEINIDGNPQPRIGRRSTESFVSARTGEIIVLGGLQRSSVTGSTSRLGPVPIIGDLLGARSKEKTRTDLVFFLRPTVVDAKRDIFAPAMEQLKDLSKAQKAELVKFASPPATEQSGKR